jgi:hypothetical protein
MALWMTSLLIGALLPYRFNVFVLLPTILVGWMFVAATAMAQGAGLWWALFSMIVTALGLQIGYLCGIAILHMIATRRASSAGEAWPNPPQSVG